MKNKLSPILFIFVLMSTAITFAAQPRSEYPRPQFERSQWINLNGEWTYEFDPVQTGFHRELFESSGFTNNITVPFAPESKLSGVGHTDFIPAIWYHRTIEIPQSWAGRRIELNFGAVYYESEVYIDGKFVGRHVGGSDSFSFNITDAVTIGKKHNLVVRAMSDLRSKEQGAGKQSLRHDSFGCLYTRTTGIWQTVWLEAMSEFSIQHIQVITDIDQQQVIFTPRYHNVSRNNTLIINIKEQDKIVSEKKVSTVEGMPIVIPIKKMKLWSPENPYLYNVEYIIKDANGKEMDKVSSYLGMRKVSIEGNKIYLNNIPYYQRLVLDQGFYSDGIWTAPSDEALKRDIELGKEAGFNGARLHQKVFEERFLYWADKLGYLCWGEFPSWGMDMTSPVTARNFFPEWENIIIRDRNHPSIVTWVPFNEVWYIDNVQYPRFVEDTYRLTHSVDPTRPVNTVSGGVLTPHYDICCMHHYEQDGLKLKDKVYNSATGEFFNKQPDSKVPHQVSSNVGIDDRYYKADAGVTTYDGKRPYLLDEFGGIKCLEANPVEGVTSSGSKKSWGYGNSAVTKEEFYERLEGQVDAILSISDKVWGFCYTQLTDVEQEENGIYYYNREKKYDPARLKAIFGKALPESK